MKTGEIAKQFDVTPQTIRNWLTEFAEYFDEKESRQANIGQDGFVILATINELSKAGGDYKAIHERLKDGYRTEDLETYITPLRLIPMEQAIESGEIRAELETVKSERDRLLQETAEQKETIQKLNEQIRELERKLGRAEGIIEEKEKRRRWF